MKENYLEEIKAIQAKAKERQSVHKDAVAKYNEDMKNLEKEIEKQLPPIGTILVEKETFLERDVKIRGYKVNPTLLGSTCILVSKRKKDGNWSKIYYCSFSIKIDNVWNCIKK